MYCPNCGQQQTSVEMRFCSRCGLSLSALAEWLSGNVPVKRAEETRVLTPSRQRKAMRRAAKLGFFGAAAFPIFLLMSIGIDEPGPLFLPLIAFFAAGIWMLYARLFMGDAQQIYQAPQPSAFGPTPTARVSLPPPTNLPMPDIGRQRVKTNELVEVPSVTEHTTRLLDNE